MSVDSASLRLVPAVDRAARILDMLDAEGRPLTISEVARMLEINKGTTRDLLETLRAHGLLERDDARKTYRLGPRLARLGMTALGQLDVCAVAHAFLAELASWVTGTVLLVMPHGDRATIVDRVGGGRVAVEVSADIGSRIRLAAGACGKVFLAYSVGLDVRHYLSEVRPTANTICDIDAYQRELERVRRQGYATDDEEYLTGVRATSAPVFDARGRLVAAVLVVALTGSLAVSELDATGARTAETAKSISAALGAPD